MPHGHSLRKSLCLFLLCITISLASASSVFAKLSGSQLVRGNAAEPESLDPQQIHSLPAINIANDLFDGLVTRDRSWDIVPAQATRWDVSNNGRVWTFHLRQSQWSNGTPVTAEDFVYAWQRAVDPKTASPYAWYLEMLGITHADAIIRGELPPSHLGVTAKSPDTLEVTLDRPLAWFLETLTHPVLFPVPREIVKQHGENWIDKNNIVSNGSYTLTDWVVNEHIVLAANKHHPAYKHLKISQVSYLPLTSPSAEYHRYQAGELDITSGLPANFYAHIKKKQAAEIQLSRLLGTEYYAFNTRKAPFMEANLRKALAYAIDRQILTEKVLGEGQIPAYTFTPPYTSSMPDYTPNYQLMSSEERLTAAREFYRQAGYSSTHPLKVSILYNTSESRKKIAIAIAQMWKQGLGVEVELINQEWKAAIESIKTGQFDLARASWIADFDEASSMLSIFASDHSSNKARFHYPEYDRLMTTALTTLDIHKREKLYEKLEGILNQEMPVIPLYHYVTARLVSPRVGNYYSSPQDQIYTRHLYLKQ